MTPRCFVLSGAFCTHSVQDPYNSNTETACYNSCVESFDITYHTGFSTIDIEAGYYIMYCYSSCLTIYMYYHSHTKAEIYIVLALFTSPSPYIGFTLGEIIIIIDLLQYLA